MFRNLFKKKFEFDLTPDQDKFLASAIQGYNESLEKILSSKFNGFDNWGFDQESGILTIEKGSEISFTAEGQIIGSYNKYNTEWQWAWNNPNVLNRVKNDSLFVKEYGEREKLWYFKEGKVPSVTLEQATYLAAVGMKLSNSETIFAGSAGHVLVYIMLKNIKEKG